MRQHPRLLRRYFYAGEIPAVSYPNSRGEELQVLSFQKEKGRFTAKTTAETTNQPNPLKRQRGAFLDKCRG